MHFQSEKQKSCVYFAYFSIWIVVYLALSTYNTEFVAQAVGTMNVLQIFFLAFQQLLVSNATSIKHAIWKRFFHLFWWKQ